ncbi:MAG: hypothetical protein Q8K02_05990 [Flavobacterium sp.]|nr:hypothetical protein [Flavobacterium sp.]
MKYLIIIFLALNYISYSQNSIFTLKASRLIQEYDDGPCSIKSYLEDDTVFYVQSIDLNIDAHFIAQLKSIQKKSMKWKSVDFICFNKCIGCETVDNMLVYSDSKQNDTIYFVDNFTKIYNPKKQKIYIDENQSLRNLFSKKDAFIEFIDTNFNSIIEEVTREKRDSITIQSIKINDKSINETIDIIENKINKNQTDSLNQVEIIKEHNLIVDLNSKKRITTIQTSNLQSEYSITINYQTVTTESQILELFPDSKKETNYRKKYFKDKDGIYTISIKITENLGWISFNMKDEIIQTIEIVIY